MTNLSPRLARSVFVFSILLLGEIVYFADRSAIRYAASEGWVSHTRGVESQIALLAKDMYVVCTLRVSGDPQARPRRLLGGEHTKPVGYVAESDGGQSDATREPT